MGPSGKSGQQVAFLDDLSIDIDTGDWEVLQGGSIFGIRIG